MSIYHITFRCRDDG